jgi:hypothetical protein
MRYPRAVELFTFVDGELWARTAPPRVIAPRAWILGVVAVQISVEDGRPVAQVRAHVTGAARAEVRRLGARALVQVALADAPPAPLPFVAPQHKGPVARLTVALDGALLGEAQLLPSQLGAEPAPRAFGHVFCRWLRDGGFEPGFDLTAFLSLPGGQKFERLLSRPLALGQWVSYAWQSQAGILEP